MPFVRAYGRSGETGGRLTAGLGDGTGSPRGAYNYALGGSAKADQDELARSAYQHARALLDRGRGSLGDIASDQTAIIRGLQKQVNRFVPSLVPAPVAVTGILDANTAAMAAAIMFARANDAALGIPSDASTQLLVNAARNLSNPVPYVTQNAAAIAAVAKMYGDAKGLAPAPGSSTFTEIVSDKRVLVAGGALALGVLVLLRRRRGGR